jgi:hypothetical protein
MSESTALSESTAVYYNIMGTTSTRQPQSKLLCSGARASLTLVDSPGRGSELGAYQGKGRVALSVEETVGTRKCVTSCLRLVSFAL